ncbi:MBL fold metallo-hydrolase [Clostridium senegalense]|uniref:MBL fold metallo-hydrolase n=1 Tax=Clostridium senegalense TaxID=1465809 RepID=A0A6M0H041_9CLOT|nr:MBL fold metallo-hydrolase [Clostridium senegalense]NEU04196.1 MBL fold metallo-hydrolase [Clostridium senegalense]
MEEWFTIESIDDNTYSISEYGHWEKVHSYLLIGKEYALLIDTGLGIGNIKKEVDKLTNLPIIVITTHVHWDHIGGHKFFNHIYVHKQDAEWLSKGIPIPNSVVCKNIMMEPFIKNPPIDFKIEDYKVYIGNPTKIIEDNYIIDIGSRKLRVIHTPGHSPGHICLFEEEKGYLYTGDLIYKGTLYAFYPSTDPQLFKKSIDKISNLKGIVKILPSHNELNINVNLVEKIKHGFKEIEDNGQLNQGSGLFDFGDFKIKI